MKGEMCEVKEGISNNPDTKCMNGYAMLSCEGLCVSMCERVVWPIVYGSKVFVGTFNHSIRCHIMPLFHKLLHESLYSQIAVFVFVFMRGEATGARVLGFGGMSFHVDDDDVLAEGGGTRGGEMGYKKGG